MFTGRMRIRVPGIFAPSESDTPSLGCIVRISWLGRTPTEPSCWKARCGTGLSVDRDLGDLARQPLAGAQVERHAGPAPVVDLAAAAPRRSRSFESAGTPVLLEVAGDVLAADGARGVLGADGDRRRPRPRVGGVIARRTLTFSSRTSSAVKCTGGSIAQQAAAAGACGSGPGRAARRRCRSSRRGVPMPMSSAAVIWTWSM